MAGPMGNPGMVGMGNQMVPPYGAAMQNQMGNMAMGPQVNDFHFCNSDLNFRFLYEMKKKLTCLIGYLDTCWDSTEVSYPFFVD